MADFYSSLTLSSLQSISNPFSTNHLIQRIHSTLHSLHSIGSQITFNRIPGHIGLIPEHDAVDKAAEQATSFPKITDFGRLPVSDLKNHYRALILQSRNSFRKTQPPNKLLIKQIPSPWSSSNRDSKRNEFILIRLRIGHFGVTHSYPLNRFILSPPSCPHCHEGNLSLSRFFSCAQLQSLPSSLKIPPSPSQALTKETITPSLQYLRLTKFFSLI